MTEPPSTMSLFDCARYVYGWTDEDIAAWSEAIEDVIREGEAARARQVVAAQCASVAALCGPAPRAVVDQWKRTEVDMFGHASVGLALPAVASRGGGETT